MWAAKETALKSRFTRTADSLNEHARDLKPLNVGDVCYIQNQTGNFPRRWDRTGVVVEVLDHNKYSIKVHGSGRCTIRNRQFLRKYFAIDRPQQNSEQPAHCFPRTDYAEPQNLDKPVHTIVLPTHQESLPLTQPATRTQPSPSSPCQSTSQQFSQPSTISPVVTNRSPEKMATSSSPIPEEQPQLRRSQRQRQCPKNYDASSGLWL